ncbi:MAG TPA: polysaccharide deacetylase family protein [Xanthobacteraceae bacterium]|nr:polysaccharide deacetylase family protein [Xanthobacteraceae bacterium]
MGLQTGLRRILNTAFSAAVFSLPFLFAVSWAQAAEDCPGHPGAMGVSRTIVLDPAEHPRLGTLQYDESLPLKDHEVVLTFDDGPLPPYTNRVLDTLAAECIKATFFLVGRMALGYPQVVRREYNEGHTIAGHSQNHPFTFAKMSVDDAAKEIEDGFASLRTVLGDPKAVAPFFRIPGLLRQDSVEQYLQAHGYATWSLDFLADDWTHISAKEITRRALQRIEARGRGILLLHDIQPATALALPTIIAELKARGYKIVHVVPTTPDRPATVANNDDWVQRHRPRPSWPRVLEVGTAAAQPTLDAPSPANFGVSPSTGEVVALGAAAAEKSTGSPPLPRNAPWPSETRFAVPTDNALLPSPAAQDFLYYTRKTSLAFGPPPERKTARQGLVATSKLTPRPPNRIPGFPVGGKDQGGAAAHSHPIGHQLTVTKPTASNSEDPRSAVLKTVGLRAFAN